MSDQRTQTEPPVDPELDAILRRVLGRETLTPAEQNRHRKRLASVADRHASDNRPARRGGVHDAEGDDWSGAPVVIEFPHGTSAPHAPRMWPREVGKLVAAAIVFGLVGALLALTLRGGDNNNDVASPSTPAVVTPSAAVTETPAAGVTVVPGPTLPPSPDVSAFGTLAARIPLGENPSELVRAGGMVWVSDSHDGTVSIIDPATNAVVETLQVVPDFRPNALGWAPIAADAQSVWVSISEQGEEPPYSITRIDIASRKPVGTISLDFRPTDIAASGRGVWVAGSVDNKVAHIDPDRETVIATIDFMTPAGVVADDTAVWVTNPSKVVRLDPQTNLIVAEIPLGQTSGFAALGPHGLWVSTGRQTVVRIDPATNEIVAEIAFETNRTYGVADGASGVWVAIYSELAEDRALGRIDPATNQVVGMAPVPANAGAIIADETSVWFISLDDKLVNRLALASSASD